ncbi:hypothetical protein [Urbifossiella limnaea]|uniref:Uncharacterized protein n=1 Tax=Urbifossiella limnaea TaxID=2528023 RepID=A0A517Y1Y7_9BACT|nr:hypothetical protein [Urbifossiella limnaea]QDU23744.1 hypothetical protein ETAA1_57510 [Urbifossiella limnaea]
MSAFVLERFSWRRVGPAGWVRLPGEVVVDRFDAAEDAHTEQARREADVRELVGHPFRCGTTLAEFTTLPEFAFLDWLRAADLDPPDRDPDGRTPWLAWADLFAGGWTPAQLAHVWEGCNRVRFFRVRERAGDPLHCVLRVNWWRDMNDTNFLSESEGGTPLALWHDRPAAERDRTAKQALAAAETAAAQRTLGEPDLAFDPGPRAAAANPFGPTPVPQPTAEATAVSHADVIDVDRGEPELGVPAESLADTAFVVVRFGWEPLTDEFDAVPGLFERPDGVGGVPVRVFARREEAERFRDRGESEYRAFANPYRFRPAGLRRGGWDAHDLPAAVRDLGIDRPFPAPARHDFVGHRRACADWWTHVAGGLTDAQRAGLWELTWESGPLALYEVRQLRVGDARHRPPRRVRTLYYVRATNWIPDGGPANNPVRFLGAFADPARAEAVRDEAERAFRDSPPPDSPPPFPWEPDRDWTWYSSLTVSQARQHLVDHGLIDDTALAGFLPDPGWWQYSPRRPFRTEQVRALWEVFDRVRLYEVLALPTEVGE